jgi:aspartate oxidase
VRREKKNQVRREKKNRVRREKNDRARQLQKSQSTTQNELLKRRNLLKIEIARRTTLLHDLKRKTKEREQKRKKEERLRQSSEQLFEFSQCSHSSAIDLTVLSVNEKSSIDLSKRSRMTDALIRSSRDALTNMSSSFQDVDVDSFID